MSVLPLASQINHGAGPPVRHCALKPEVIFCVQGASSPLLANVYLHYVFDLWAERWRRREAHGDMNILRYADDLIVGFEREADARRFLAWISQTWTALERRRRCIAPNFGRFAGTHDGVEFSVVAGSRSACVAVLAFAQCESSEARARV